MILCDYYGRLGKVRQRSAEFKRTLIHDVAQIVSGQGVPPSCLEGWREIYSRTSCTLVKAFEGRSEGLTWFIHVIQL